MAVVTLSTDPARLDLGRIHGWLRESDWSPGVRPDIVEKAFAAGISVGAYGEKLYQPLGFVPVDPQRWMELRPPIERWSE